MILDKYHNQLPRRSINVNDIILMPPTSPRSASVRSRRPASPWRPWASGRSRVNTFVADTEGLFGSPKEHRDANEFRDYLKTFAGPARAIHILEGIASDFTSVLQTHFQLDDMIFKDHNRLFPFNNRITGEAGGLPFLPSHIHSRPHLSFKYHETLTVSPRPTDFRNLCHATGRHIMASRVAETFSDVVILRRRCTVWSRRTQEGGWTCTYSLRNLQQVEHDG